MSNLYNDLHRFISEWVRTHDCRYPRRFAQHARRPMSARPVEVSTLHSSSHCRSVLGCDLQDIGFWRRYIWVSLMEIEMSTLKWQVIHCTPDISLTLSPRNAQQTPHRYPMVVFIVSSKTKHKPILLNSSPNVWTLVARYITIHVATDAHIQNDEMTLPPTSNNYADGDVLYAYAMLHW